MSCNDTSVHVKHTLCTLHPKLVCTYSWEPFEPRRQTFFREKYTVPSTCITDTPDRTRTIPACAYCPYTTSQRSPSACGLGTSRGAHYRQLLHLLFSLCAGGHLCTTHCPLIPVLMPIGDSSNRGRCTKSCVTPRTHCLCHSVWGDTNF